MKTFTLGLFLAALPFVLSSNQTEAGPGADLAVKDNRDMCTLPPFLNVAVTDKPNIMIMYANTSSMALPAYTRPYKNDQHYYGLFDADACYTSNGAQFTKDYAKYPRDTVENAAGVWIANPLLDPTEKDGPMDPDSKIQHMGSGEDGLGKHRCNSGRFSGNFLNWATMRRIDLLRKAFSGGLSANSGNQNSQWVGAEGVQTGNPAPFAPCFSKSYSGTGVSPYGINQIKVVSGKAYWGMQCSSWEETITAKLEIPVPGEQGASQLAYSDGSSSNDREITLSNISHDALPKRRALVRPNVASEIGKYEGFSPFSNAPKDAVAGTIPPPPTGFDVAPQGAPAKPKLVQVASLWQSMLDVGLSLIQPVTPYIDIDNTTISFKTVDATSGLNNSTTQGYWGDKFQFTFTGTNTGGSNATSIYGYINLQFGGYSYWLYFSNADCKLADNPNLGANLSAGVKWNSGATRKMTCGGTMELPVFWNSAAATPSATVYVYPDGYASEVVTFLNDGVQVNPQYTVLQVNRPDATVSIGSYDIKAGIVGMPVKFNLTVYNQSPLGSIPAGTAVRMEWQSSSGTKTIATPVGTCQTPVVIPASSNSTFQCTFSVPNVTTAARYHLVATVDPTDVVVEIYDSNNTTMWWNGFWVHKTTGQKGVDLQATSITVLSGATVGTPGASYWVEIEVVNVGAVAFTNVNSTEAVIVLSKDSTFTSGDLQVNDLSVNCDVPALTVYPDANYRKKFNCKLTIPASIDPSEYAWAYLAAVITPIELTPGESPDEAPDNVGRFFPIEYGDPRLTIDSLWPSPSSGLAINDWVSVWTVIRNQGKATTFTSGIKFYWSADAVLDTTVDQELVTTDLSGWASDSCTLSKSIWNGGWGYGYCGFQVPLLTNGLPTVDGSYYVFAWIDPGKTAAPAEQPQPAEHNNNVSSFVVTVGAPPPMADLIISNLQVPAETGPGQVLGTAFYVRNIGAASTVTWPTVKITFVADGGTNTATCTVPRNLMPNDWHYLECGVLVPSEAPAVPSVNVSDPPQSYTIHVDADPDNTVAEGTETNNRSSGTTTVRALSACSGTCDYTLKIDRGGDGRVGILWTFRKKVAGTLAPANLGVTTFDDWANTGAAPNDPWQLTGNGFAGVEQNQQMANNIIPHLEQAVPRKNGNLARILLNVVKYYADEVNFRVTTGAGTDPMKYDPVANAETGPHPCRKNYILMITDGYSYTDWDTKYPVTSNLAGVTDLRFYKKDNTDQVSIDTMLDTDSYQTRVPNTACDTCGLTTQWNGSYHLDNVARYARQEDIRGDISGTQNVTTLIVHAFATSDISAAQAARATRLLKTAAIQGSYTEKDGTPGPTSEDEWNGDRDSAKLPDGYFPATEDKDVGQVILDAISTILLKTASGTSVSVIASTARGEGAIYQSYFRPSTAESVTEVNWLGYLQALWVDKYGTLREDSDGDQSLNLVNDLVVCTTFNTASNETVAVRWRDVDGDGTKVQAGCMSSNDGDDSKYDPGPMPLTVLQPIFETGRLLWEADSKDRVIYTWPHPSDEAAPSSAYPELPFTEDNAAVLSEYMWPAGNVYYGDVSWTTSLINWTRGDQINDLTFRNRLLTIKGVTNSWKLGDIVYSTPTIVGAPEERYDLLYGARANGYQEFFLSNRARRRLVLVGANDGMMHAFNGGYFKDGDNPGTPGKDAAWFDPGDKDLGQEMWAYIPGSLLQNLRILADAAYDTTCHLYSVDLKPKVTDVQIFFDSSGAPLEDLHDVGGEKKNRYANGWGTILIGGMRLGCGKTVFSSYFVLDITNPDHPSLLAEFGPATRTSDGSALNPAGPDNHTSLDGLNFSYFYPIVMRVNDSSVTRTDDNGKPVEAGRWVLVVGSGPESVRFVNGKNPAVYMFDLTKMGERNGNSPGGFGRGGGSDLTTRRLEEMSVALTTDKFTVPLTARSVVSNGLTVDMDGDFNVDGAYLVTQIDQSGAGKRLWGSEVWRLNPKQDAAKEVLEPLKNWTITKVFTTGTAYRQPAVGQPSVSRDPYNNLWLYFGTGRFLYKNATDPEIDDITYGAAVQHQQAMYGIIDPCWTNEATGVGGLACPGLISDANLVEVGNMDTSVANDVATVSNCTVTGGASCTIAELANYASAGVRTAGGKLGWRRTLWRATPEKEWELKVVAGEVTAVKTTRDHVYCTNNSLVSVCEMSYTKPAVAGGLVLFTTYAPGYSAADGQCTLGGRSYLYALDYQTGVASGADIFNSAETANGSTQMVSMISIGSAPPSAPSIFGNQVFVQGSDANVTAHKTSGVFKQRPHARGWTEQ